MAALSLQIFDRAAPGRQVRRAVQLFLDRYLASGLLTDLPEEAVDHLYEAAALAAAIANVPRNETTLAIAAEEFLQRLQLWCDADALDQGEALLARARMLLARRFATTKH
jgi:cytosine/adenosine deaminase-related metal-dependent hydrolase